MVRGDGNIYARFKDTPESANTTAPNEGDVELVKNGSNVNVCDIERQDLSTKALAAAVRKIYICLVTICIVVIVLLVFTATNFVLIMKRHKITNSDVNTYSETSKAMTIAYSMSSSHLSDKECLRFPTSVHEKNIECASRDKVVPQQSKQEDATETQYHIQLRDEIEENPQDPLSKDFLSSDHACEVYIGSTCYWLATVEGENFRQALGSCKINKGDPGVVHSNNYQSILQYMRQKSELNTSSAWLGMTRDSATGDIQVLHHGKFEDSLHWLPGYPSTESGATSLCLQADKNANSTNNGLLNVNPQRRDQVQSILCEMPWNDGGQNQGDYDYDYTTAATSNSTEN